MNIRDILKHLPHRYPFLLVDRVLEFESGKSLVALKNVSYNEPFFLGHFPQRPVMPGVLILEAMAEATGLLAFRTGERKPKSNSLYYLVGIDKARFKRPVEPGDQLILTIELLKVRRNIWVFSGRAEVEGQLAASAEIICTERDIES